MFTGLVEEVGTVTGIKKGARSAQLTIAADKTLAGTKLGDSIAVNGVCLTVVAYTSQTLTVDVMDETLQKTTLGKLVKGARVNLERALAVGDRFGGHFVSGHVDGVGKILDRRWVDIASVVTISAPADLMHFIIEKGSIAVDGVSLTTIQVSSESFSVSLIPHTREQTTLGEKVPGDEVNLETDILGKYVWKMLAGLHRPKSSRIDYSFLAQHGFIEPRKGGPQVV